MLLLVFCIACFAGQEKPTPDKKAQSKDTPAPQAKKSEPTVKAAARKEETPKVLSPSKISEKPKRRASFSKLTAETHFEDAIEILRNSTDPPLQIVVMWRDLRDNADVYRHTPVGIDGISGIKVGTALNLMLRSVSTQSFSDVNYVVKEGIIIIGTDATIGKKKMVPRVYDVSHLTSPAFGYGPVFPSFGMPGFGGAGGGFGAGGFGQGGMGGNYGGGGFGNTSGPSGSFGPLRSGSSRQNR
jgi:hypothetical protein